MPGVGELTSTTVIPGSSCDDLPPGLRPGLLVGSWHQPAGQLTYARAHRPICLAELDRPQKLLASHAGRPPLLMLARVLPIYLVAFGLREGQSCLEDPVEEGFWLGERLRLAHHQFPKGVEGGN